MKEIVVLAMSGSGVLGGGETLVMRMVRWLRRNEYRTMVMYNKTADLVPSLTAFFDEQGVERLIVPDLDGRSDMLDFTRARAEFPKGSCVKILCFHSSFNFFAAQMLQHSLRECHVDVVHYIIHENDYCRNLSQRTSNPIIIDGFQRRYCKLVEGMEKNGNIAYMTAECRNHIFQTLGISDGNESPPIIRLGMEIAPYDEEKNRRRFRREHFTITATARLDFPTKGFLLGLVDEFEQVLAVHPSARLVLIGDGADEAELKKKVSASNAKDAITMTGAVLYEQLPWYLEQSNLCVSNGTGPLDAANTGLLSIVANFNTCDCLTTGYWCDDVTNVGYNGTIPAHKLILKTIELSEDEYLSISRRNYEAFRQTYGMDTVMAQLLGMENKASKPLLSYGYLYSTRLIRKLMNYLTR